MGLSIGGIQESVLRRKTLLALIPPAVFWSVGALSVLGLSGAQAGWAWFVAQPVTTQLGVLALALIPVGASILVIERAQDPFLRLVEGYWPTWADGIFRRQAGRWQDRIVAMQVAQQISANVTATPSSGPLARHFVALETALAPLPSDPDYAMPTLLGNVLRAAELDPLVRYGLDSIGIWPRLYPLLPSELRTMLDDSRSHLDEMSQLMLWSLLLLIWAFWQPWALVGLVLFWLSYRCAVQDAMAYGELIRAAFDLHRFDLYRALCWPLPLAPDDEAKDGDALSEYVVRGTVELGRIYFQHPPRA